MLFRSSKIVVSEDAAKKLFGQEEPIGKRIKIDGGNDYEVTGVAKNVPNNSHIKFDYLVSYETLNNSTRNEDGDRKSVV